MQSSPGIDARAGGGSTLPGISQLVHSPTKLAELVHQGGIRRQISELPQKLFFRHPLPWTILAILVFCFTVAHCHSLATAYASS